MHLNEVKNTSDAVENCSNSTKIKICDAPMGFGKSSAAINYMNDSKDLFVYITPFVDETERIHDACADREFMLPDEKIGRGSKYRHFCELVAEGKNVAATHSLFKYMDDKCIKEIKRNHYKLIVDEVFNVVSILPLKESDVRAMSKLGIVTVNAENGAVSWNEEAEVDAGIYLRHKSLIQSGNVFLFRDTLMIWTFPCKMFDAFDEVIIMTYLFDAQFQSYYYKMNNISYEKIGVLHDDSGYHFTSKPQLYKNEKLQDLVHICQDSKLNKCGDNKNALSSSWYRRTTYAIDSKMCKTLHNHMRTYFEKRVKAKSDEILWSCFNKNLAEISGVRYKKRFLAHNSRATNAYRSRTKLAYLVNLYMNPYVRGYFENYGVKVNENTNALSTMIQWIWRSAIRDGNEIWIYLPSSRMRWLLETWLTGMAEGVFDMCEYIENTPEPEEWKKSRKKT